jgi:hypothetical protein
VHPQRQCELLSGPEHCHADYSRHANEQRQRARGKGSLTNLIFQFCDSQATTRKRGWWLFCFPRRLKISSI